jgi:glycosyltransferase involved in cell wall biosynthesis
VSVVIPTYNGSATLPATLRSLEQQTLERSMYEVIVVDDASSDASASIAEAHGASVVRLSQNAGAAAARNRGTAEARAPIVAFTDDDCTADANWLERLIAPFEDLSVDGAGGRIVPRAPDGLLLRYMKDRNPWEPLSADLLTSHHPVYRLWLYLRGLLGAGSEGHSSAELYAVAGGNMAFRATFLEDLGGFDGDQRVSEETELCRRAHKRPGGARIVNRPSAVVYHEFRPRLAEILRRSHWYGEGAARFAAKHDDVNLIVYPFPVVVATAAVLALASRDRHIAAAVPILPVVTYFGWPLTALRRRSLEPLLYAYLQMAQETATMFGELAAVRSGSSGTSGNR